MFGHGPSVPQISSQDAQARITSEQPPLVVDVREPEEHQAGHIPGCKLVPLGTLGERLAEFPKDQEFLVVCRSGGRSAKATQYLRQAGYQAVNVEGGMLAWQGPVER